MTTTDRRFFILAVGTGLYLLGLGFLGGVVADRIAFDQQRAAILQHYDAALEQWQAYRMALEKSVLPEPRDGQPLERMVGHDAGGPGRMP